MHEDKGDVAYKKAMDDLKKSVENDQFGGASEGYLQYLEGIKKDNV